MDKRNTGGPAFPMQNEQAIHAFAIGKVQSIADTEERDRVYMQARAEAIGGMSMRDYFAAKAMQGWTSNPLPDDQSIQEVAAWAYRQADAMLKAREKP